ncbi:dihydrolipoyl dehydrogenase [Comamonas granuli]|uniref:dihydrolipoyl dehydrogenase n=1 Tax=Comamonas granuli TaxID=290309 RepID=UPI0005A63FAC|nr:dihydrolipoyl dehydrogenase [Comamonas granuli]
MKEITTRLLVIGGGPGGYVAAIRAGQLGIPTVLAEGAHLGGTCLNIGCIPSKALIHAAHEFERARHQAQGSPLGIRVQEPSIDIAQTVRWKDGIVKRLSGGVAGLLRKAGVQVLKGWARIEDGKTVTVQAEGGESVRVRCEHLLLATGSEPVELPSMPFGGAIWSSTDALSPDVVPKRLVVVGAGYIGLELGMAYRKLGVEVTVVEAAQRVLPSYDEELTQPVLDALQKSGVVLHLGCSVQGYDAKHGVHVRNARADEFALPAERVLVAVGRRPRTAGFGLESLQLDMAGRYLAVDAHCRTSMRNVWAIGDVTGEPMLAHRAMAQGECVAEQIAGQSRRFEPMAIPAVCFTDPEVVVVGKTPGEARAAGLDCIDAAFPFSANGRAMTLEATGGFVRVVARRDNHLILGWQAVGQGVAELAAAFTQSIEMGARLEDVAGTIHAHPTLGEAVQEAALRALGHAVHI